MTLAAELPAVPVAAPPRPLEREVCRHCGQPAVDADLGGFCCRGCRAVYQLLHTEKLERFYTLRAGKGTPVAQPEAERRERAWLPPYQARLAAATGSCRLTFDVQGISCAACVWLLQTLFARQPGALHLLVNPGLGVLDLVVTREFPLRAWIDTVERLGYLVGPPLKRPHRAADALLLRAAICIALAINSMMLSAALYMGLREGPLHRVVAALDQGFGVLAVLVGGPVFFRSAWHGLRRGVLHLDVPISLGMLLSLAGSLWSFARGGDPAYADSIAAFVALMVLGRWLQQRITAANRDRLLASEGAAGLRCQRVCSGRPVLGPASAIATDDTLLVAPGELVCVDAVLQSPGASFSLDWVNGESLPRHFACGDTVPAGAFLCGASAVFLRATQPFTDSALEPLLRTPPRAESDERHAGPQASPLARRVARLYVPAVLLAALAGLVAWWWHAGDLDTGLAVATAVLVVTCPCAFGIATPLAHELVQAGLRRAGLFLCSNGFLDRAAGVRRVVFDKTGTLTTGALELTAPELLNALTPAERAALWDLAARSSHPASLAVRTALEPSGLQLRPEVTTWEVAGHGVETRIAGHGYRLGARCWATGSGGRELVFAVDGHLRLILPTRERIRPDAAAELAALRRAGHELWILSGDAQGRVDALAGRLGISGDRALGERSPQGKAAWLAATDRGDTLFIGDGVNDSLGCEQAHCSGTPAIDRPFLPARSDFYFVTPGLAPVALALRAARHLARVVRRNLVIAIGYNAAAVSLAWAGLMKPWLAAILMPSSSILVVLTTVMSLSPRSALWKS